MSEVNGHEHNQDKPAMPGIEVYWDADKQRPILAFDPDKIKGGWPFIIGLLGMAQQFAQDQHDEHKAMTRLQRLQQQAQGQEIAKKLQLGK
jgi:hypothetical protein